MKILTPIFLVLLSLISCNSKQIGSRADRLDKLMQKAYHDKQFIGSVLVAEGDSIIYLHSFGLADTRNASPNTDTTKFLLASVSKPITALLIMKLADQQKLLFDDPLSKYFPVADPGIRGITIHQLLTHTSGINEIISKDTMPDMSALTLKSRPGEKFEYSNSGYVILKDIAQKVTGEQYDSLLHTLIFVPAGMIASGVAKNADLPGLAKGYKDADQLEPATLDYSLTHVDGAGSVYSTAIDLYKLDRALYTQVLLSDKMKIQMLKQQVPERFSYGWYVRERNGLWDVYWHKGSFAGFASLISRRIGKRQFVALLSNVEHTDLSELENEIYKILKVR
jgi:CubicO group peptidase (beta-lactamase class C family)